jgi:hypothetical protein
VLLTFFPVSSGIRDTKVFFGGLDEFFTKALLKFGILSVGQRLLSNIVAVLNIILLGLSEALELLLKSSWVCFLCCSEEVWLLFYFLWFFHKRLSLNFRIFWLYIHWFGFH